MIFFLYLNPFIKKKVICKEIKIEMTVKNFFVSSVGSALITLALVYWWTQQANHSISNSISGGDTSWPWSRAWNGQGQNYLTTFNLNSFANSQPYAVVARSINPTTGGLCPPYQCKILMADANGGVPNTIPQATSFQLTQTSYNSTAYNQPTEQCVETSYAVPVKRGNQIVPGRFTLIPNTNSNSNLGVGNGFNLPSNMNMNINPNLNPIGQKSILTLLASSKSLDENQNYKWVIVVITRQGQGQGQGQMNIQPYPNPNLNVNPNVMVLSLVGADIDWASIYAAYNNISQQYPNLPIQLVNIEACYLSIDFSQWSRAIGGGPGNYYQMMNQNPNVQQYLQNNPNIPQNIQNNPNVQQYLQNNPHNIPQNIPQNIQNNPNVQQYMQNPNVPHPYQNVQNNPNAGYWFDQPGAMIPPQPGAGGLGLGGMCNGKDCET